MNSENSRTSEYHVLLLKLTNKLGLKIGQKKCSFIKSYYLVYMEKRENLIQ